MHENDLEVRCEAVLNVGVEVRSFRGLRDVIVYVVGGVNGDKPWAITKATVETITEVFTDSGKSGLSLEDTNEAIPEFVGFLTDERGFNQVEVTHVELDWQYQAWPRAWLLLRLNSCKRFRCDLLTCLRLQFGVKSFDDVSEPLDHLELLGHRPRR